MWVYVRSGCGVVLHTLQSVFKFLDSLVEAILDCEFDKGKT
jgi:hypothetical protein